MTHDFLPGPIAEPADDIRQRRPVAGAQLPYRDEDGEHSLAALFSGMGDTGAASAAALRYLATRRDKEEAEMAAKRAGLDLANAEADLLRALDEAKLLAVKVQDTDGRPVNIGAGTSTYYSLPAAALDDLGVVAWLKDAGGADLLKQTVHHMSFTAFARELAEAGKKLHEAVRVAEKRVVRVRRD